MDITSSNPIENPVDFHLDIVPPKTRQALEFFSKEEWFGKSDWYLAGGTALALQTGHRVSVDLDFFTRDVPVDTNALLEHFSTVPEWMTDINKENTVYGELFGAKVSFIAYPFFIPKEKYIPYGRVKILQLPDIAVMKIIAISQRGRKRDFFDLYWLANHGQPLESIVTKLKSQYPSVAHDYHHILKSLVYFVDAEEDPTPEINVKMGWNGVNWDTIKKFFIMQVPMITRKLVELV